MSERTPRLRTYAAPADLLERALHRSSVPPVPRRSGWMLAAALFLVGVGVGRVALPSGPASARAPAAVQAVNGRVVVPGTPVRFVYVAENAHSVAIAGSWNEWQPEAASMVRGEGGRFFAEIELPPGQYEYQLVIDRERWAPDPSAPLARDDGFGRQNSVLTI
jgi:hypothetical protein